MDGWPEGWACFGAGGPNERFVSAGDRYVLYGEREGCRRAAWAIEGGAGAVDREALAKALLHAQHTAWGSPDAPWEGYKLAYRDSWLTVADEASRLLGGAAKPAKALYDEIEELKRRNAALTATANAAVARAEEAQLRARQAEEERDVLRDYDSPFEADAENLRAEVQRLRRALDRTAQGAAYLTDALSELAGGDHA